MGKAAKLKAFRRIASCMPMIPTIGTEVSFERGIDLINNGVHSINGISVNPDKNYRMSKTVQVPMNHNNIMKQLYYKEGEKGALGYMRAIQTYKDSKGL